MPSILLTAPAVEPVTLDEAKAFLRVEHNGYDEVIAALAAGSRIHVEAQTRRALITQGWRISADHWPADGRLQVRPAPLQSLDAARICDFESVAHEVDTQAFVADLANSALIFAPWRCRRGSPPASSSTSPSATAMPRSTCPRRCARRSAC